MYEFHKKIILQVYSALIHMLIMLSHTEAMFAKISIVHLKVPKIPCKFFLFECILHIQQDYIIIKYHVFNV